MKLLLFNDLFNHQAFCDASKVTYCHSSNSSQQPNLLGGQNQQMGMVVMPGCITVIGIMGPQQVYHLHSTESPEVLLVRLQAALNS